MARSRNIKPGFFTNDVLGELPALTRLLFAGLWTICDRDGRVEDRPKKIRAEVLPYDQCDPEEMLQALHDSGFILRYEVAGKRLIQVLAWADHQNPHVKEAVSTLPAPGESGASPVLVSDKEAPLPEPAGLIPSSLIPDSLNSDSSPNGETRKRAPAIARPDDVSEQTWADWCQLRKGHNAKVSETALSEARKESQKADMPLQRFLEIWCLRGTRGLLAEWLRADERKASGKQSEPEWRTEQRERTRIAAPGVAAGQPAAQFFIDVEAKHVTPHALDR